MDHGIREIDHLLTAVKDPLAAGADFERLGFTVTPVSHIAALGIANRLVVFSPFEWDTANFIELMGMVSPGRVPPRLEKMLAGGEGGRCLVMMSDDAHAAYHALVAAGYGPEPVTHLRRSWELPGGERLEVELDVIPAMKAPFAFNVCRYYTLQHYHREDFRNHRNGVDRLEAVYCVSDHPARDAAFYVRLFGAAAKKVGPGCLAVRRRHVELVIFTPDAFRAAFNRYAGPGFAGYRLKSRSLDHTRRHFDSLGIAVGDAHEGLYLPAELTHGNLMHIV